jgi:hypothetical protein
VCGLPLPLRIHKGVAKTDILGDVDCIAEIPWPQDKRAFHSSGLRPASDGGRQSGLPRMPIGTRLVLLTCCAF